jgi:hypothetical protein
MDCKQQDKSWQVQYFEQPFQMMQKAHHNKISHGKFKNFKIKMAVCIFG